MQASTATRLGLVVFFVTLALGCAKDQQVEPGGLPDDASVPDTEAIEDSGANLDDGGDIGASDDGGDTSTSDLGGEDAADAQPDLPQCDSNIRNLCGGCGALPAEPGASCGACSRYICDGLDNVQCVASPPNDCGGCGTLDGVPGEACGECGTWTCDGTDRVACTGVSANECGGCTALATQPGQSCGTCGQTECDGLDAVRCVDPGENACGGCTPLAETLGSACPVCGTYACDGTEALVCEGCTLDCAGTPDGTATIDFCGRCDDDPATDCAATADCSAANGWPQAWRNLENTIRDLVNERRQNGATCGALGAFPPVDTLTLSPELRTAARCHSADMDFSGVYELVGSDGSTQTERAVQAGYTDIHSAESILVGTNNANTAIATLMGDDSVCAIIMAANNDYIGVGFSSANQACLTLDFGRQR